MKIAWVLGWAVPESWFAAQAQAAFPNDEHRFFSAEPNWLDQLLAGGPWDAIAGYSLGTLLILEEAEVLGRLAPRVTLLAPVLAFAQEEQRGGKVPRAQVRYLARWVRREPTAALADFYARAGLSGCDAAGLSVSAETLQWGLEKLAQERVGELVWPRGWAGYIGSADALLDASVMKRLQPAINVIEGASHHPLELLHAWARDCR